MPTAACREHPWHHNPPAERTPELAGLPHGRRRTESARGLHRCRFGADNVRMSTFGGGWSRRSYAGLLAVGVLVLAVGGGPTGPMGAPGRGAVRQAGALAAAPGRIETVAATSRTAQRLAKSPSKLLVVLLEN